MITIETERLVLRGFHIDDANDLFQYAKSPNIGPRAGWKPVESIDEATETIKMFVNVGEVWAIELKSNNKVIGSIGLHNDKQRPFHFIKMLGYVLSEDYWGQGIVPEAAKAVLNYVFNHLHLELVTVGHFPFNLQSKRVIEKCGFIYEGTLRKAYMDYKGFCHDELLYSMTREEYFQKIHQKVL